MRLMFYISALILFSACNKALQSNIVDAPIQNHNLLQSQNVQLSPVSVSVDSSFFRSSAKVEMNFDLHQSKIKYSINDSPFRDYEKPFSVNGSSTIKSYTHKEGMLQSDTRVYQLIKVNDMLGDANLRFSVQPNDQYPGEGVSTLLDHQCGNLNFRKDKSWCGFDENIIRININLKEPINIEQFHISTLNDHASWIFNPKKIKFFADGVLVGTKLCKATKITDQGQRNVHSLQIDKTTAHTFDIEIQNLDAIPDWHPGAGSKPWLFIDEIIVE